MCPSLTFWVQLTILVILRIWYHLKKLRLKISVSKQNRNISIFYVNKIHLNVYLKHHEGAHSKNKDETILSKKMCVIK